MKTWEHQIEILADALVGGCDPEHTPFCGICEARTTDADNHAPWCIVSRLKSATWTLRAGDDVASDDTYPEAVRMMASRGWSVPFEQDVTVEVVIDLPDMSSQAKADVAVAVLAEKQRQREAVLRTTVRQCVEQIRVAHREFKFNVLTEFGRDQRVEEVRGRYGADVLAEVDKILAQTAT